MSDLDSIFQACETTIVAASINKKTLKDKYIKPNNPYHLALTFCIERTYRFIYEKEQQDAITHIVFERRGGPEDEKLELEFRRILDGANFSDKRIDCFDFCIADKKVNSSGLQMADLFARPIGLKTLRPDQANRAYDIIEQKFRKSAYGKIEGYGLKNFP